LPEKHGFSIWAVIFDIIYCIRWHIRWTPSRAG